MDEARALGRLLRDQKVKGALPRKYIITGIRSRGHTVRAGLAPPWGLMGTRPALPGLYFPFLPHSVRTGLSFLLSPLGLGRVRATHGAWVAGGNLPWAPGTSSAGKAGRVNAPPPTQPHVPARGEGGRLCEL